MTPKTNILKFSTNWNNKLDSKYFTTLRMSDRYTGFNVILIEFKGRYKVAKIVECRKLQLKCLNDWICYLDTGYSKLETLNILQKMYNLKSTDLDKNICYYLIETISDWVDLLPESSLIEF